MWVEAMAFFRLIRSFDAITVELTRGNTPHPQMPDVARPMTHRIEVNDSGRRRIVRILIELQTNRGCVTAKQNKIDSSSLLVGASNRERISGLNVARLRPLCESIRQILLCR